MSDDISDGKAVNVPQVTGAAVLGAGTDGLYHVIKVGSDGTVATSGGGGGGGGAITGPLGAQSVAASVATVVQGEAASGAAAAGNPVLIAGSNAGNAETLATDGSGRMEVVGAVASGSSDTGVNPVLIGGDNGSGGAVIFQAQGNADGRVPGNTLAAYSLAVLFNGGSWDRQRTPAPTAVGYHKASATAAGNTALWTPTSGKKFRLMRFLIVVTGNASLASAGIEEITFADGATALQIGSSVFVPAAAGTAGGNLLTTGWVDLGNGYLSAAANNVLNINLGTALATGECTVFCAGTEE